jgi:hypothetical protein
MTHPHPAEAFGSHDLHGDYHHAFADTTATLTTMLDAAYQGFIHLDFA